jgi:outer membrane protein OmpA-like peptidoglycan-associated protein
VSATSASQDTSSVLRGNLVFAPGSKQVERNETNEAVLQQIAATLHDTPEIQLLRIEGHTDDRGKPAANLELSGERALAIKHRLVAHGVSPTRLVAVGFGASRPIADNRSRAGRAQNRRTELHVINASAPNPSSDTRLNGGTEFR